MGRENEENRKRLVALGSPAAPHEFEAEFDDEPEAEGYDLYFCVCGKGLEDVVHMGEDAEEYRKVVESWKAEEAADCRRELKRRRLNVRPKKRSGR